MINLDKVLKACQQKDREAQRKLFEYYSGKMMAICLRYINNREDAKDILQDGFIKVFTNIANFKGNSTLETWMSRIFVNLSINKVTRGRERFIHVSLDETKELQDKPFELEDENSTKDVLKSIQNLPEIYRVVINMYAIDGFGHKEIGKVLGISEGSSKSRLSRARKLLIAEMKKKK